MNERFREASETLTALQKRVLGVLDTDEGLSPDEVAQRAGLERWYRKGTNPKNGEPWFVSHGPDRVTARNTLGWLASKGLAQCVNRRWYRSFSAAVTVKLQPSLSVLPIPEDALTRKGASIPPSELPKAA